MSRQDRGGCSVSLSQGPLILCYVSSAPPFGDEPCLRSDGAERLPNWRFHAGGIAGGILAAMYSVITTDATVTDGGYADTAPG